MIIELWRNKSSGVEVDAVRLTEANYEEVALWARNAQIVEEIDPEHPDEKQPGLNIQTPSGTKRASLGHMVVKVGGLLFCANGHVFEETYEPISDITGPLRSDFPRRI